jgi:hypothetical protein
MKTKKVLSCQFTLDLDDFAPFVSLLDELGIDLTGTIRLVDSNQPITNGSGRPKRRSSSKKRCHLTPQIWDEVRAYPESMTFEAIARQMAKAHSGDPRSCPSSGLIAKIRQGKRACPSPEEMA